MLEVCPMTLKEANAFVEQNHRHHKPVVGHKFSIGCTDGDKIVALIIQEGDKIKIYGYFTSKELANEFMGRIGALCGAQKGG